MKRSFQRMVWLLSMGSLLIFGGATPSAGEDSGGVIVRKASFLESAFKKLYFAPGAYPDYVVRLSPYAGIREESENSINRWVGVELPVIPFTVNGDNDLLFRAGLVGQYESAETEGRFGVGPRWQNRHVRFSLDTNRVGGGLMLTLSLPGNYFELKAMDMYEMDSPMRRNDGKRGVFDRHHTPKLIFSWWNTSAVPDSVKHPWTDGGQPRWHLLNGFGIEFFGNYMTNRDVGYSRVSLRLIIMEKNATERSLLEAMVAIGKGFDPGVSFRMGGWVESSHDFRNERGFAAGGGLAEVWVPDGGFYLNLMLGHGEAGRIYSLAVGTTLLAW